MFRKLAPIDGIPLSRSSPPNHFSLVTSNDSSNYKSSRILSLNSMLSDQTYMPKGEKIGIRKIARACTRSFTQWNDNNNRLLGVAETKPSPKSSKSALLHDNHKALFENDSKKLAQIEKKHEEDLDKMRRIYLETFDFSLDPLQQSLNKTKHKTLSKSKMSLENIRKPQDNVNLKSNNKLGNRKSSESLQFRRVIVVKNVPQNAGINDVLAQVCGGPLERIVFHEHKVVSTVELHFIFPEHARRFYNYGTKTGLLVLNGVHLKLEWANRSNTEDLDTFHPLIPKYLINEIVQYGSRRCLIFSKIVPDKQIRHEKKLHYPNPRTHFSKNLEVEEIKKDFSSFGGVIDIGSVISRKLCFSLHFADIRSAIIAKRECETEGTMMNAKYSSWSIWFGKDPTDRPCYLL